MHKVRWLAVMLMPLVLAGCLVVPGRRGELVPLVPFLPPIVMLDGGPYYVHEGYHYYHRNDGWYYSRSRSGPWTVLPKDHYPKEVRFQKGGDDRRGPGRERDDGPHPDHRGR